MVPQFNLELHNTNNDFLREVPSQQTASAPATSKTPIKKKLTETDEQITNSNCLSGGRRLQLVSRGTEFLPQNSIRNNLQPKRYHSQQNQRNRLVLRILFKI